ncbi:hypothetical protein J4E89_004431 [Alternaria sp. Ai002NY15]|nr:hypothetical protein J4E89_004431 [Alternaria sp. Ai002NY15]
MADASFTARTGAEASTTSRQYLRRATKTSTPEAQPGYGGDAAMQRLHPMHAKCPELRRTALSAGTKPPSIRPP